MRILLAAAPHRDTFGGSTPPPGLLRLGGELERAGVEVALLDLAHALAVGELPSGDELADAAAEHVLSRGNFAVVGMSVMGATLPIALAVLERIKARRPSLTTWLGGPGTSGVDRVLLERFPHVDVIVRGEGEITARELCAAHDHGQSPSAIAGVTWRDEHGTIVRETDREPIADLSTLAAPAWHLLPSIESYKRVFGGDGLVAIDSGRGCVFDCSFCTIGRHWSHRSRTLPARRLIEDVLHLLTMPGATRAHLCHDLFGANRGQAIAFCDALIARGAPVPFEVRARADHLDTELLEHMARAGACRVLIGVESADVRVRERNQKGMRRSTDLLRVVDECAAVGIATNLALILGLPGEDEDALETSLDFCAQAALRAGVDLSLQLVNPEPGCGLSEERAVRARPIAGIQPFMALGAGETASERALIAAHPDLFSTFAFLTGAGHAADIARLRELHAIARDLPELLRRHPRTFALLCETEGGSFRTLATYRAWKADGRSFAMFARTRGSRAVEEMLALERVPSEEVASRPQRPIDEITARDAVTDTRRL